MQGCADVLKHVSVLKDHTFRYVGMFVTGALYLFK